VISTHSSRTFIVPWDADVAATTQDRLAAQAQTA